MKTFYETINRAPEGDPPSPPPTPPAGDPPAGDPPAPWFAGHPDEAVRTFLTEQNVGDPNVAATKLYHANKALGGSTDVLVKPGKDATPEQRAAFHEALGVPKEATAYDFGLPPEAKVDEGFKTWAQTAFHKAGIPAEAAKEIVGGWQQFVADYQAQQAAQTEIDEKAEIDGLKKTYGTGWDQFVADGQKAQAALGLSEEHLNALAKNAGNPAYLALMAALGKKMGGEDGFRNSNGGHGAPLTPDQMSKEQAQAEINRLQGDANFQASYNSAAHPEHAAAVARMEKLFAKAG